MEKITYILGAGFSAPAGLPLMNNFILKAKELIYLNPIRYEYFTGIFKRIDELSKIKNVFRADLYNIEEVLSIFETESILNNDSKFKAGFINFISDVIEHYTFDKLDINFDYKVGNFKDFIFGEGLLKQAYAVFLCSLLKLQIRRIKEKDKVDIILEKVFDDTKYSIITLNYDMLLENCFKSIVEKYISNFDFRLNIDTYDSEWTHPHLIKLHGCVSNKSIIPPTWAKHTNSHIENIWHNAFNVIKDSTQIRFIGYSLPITDSNVRFLLKSAILQNNRLKKIDVLTLDSNGLSKNHYDNFIDFNYYDFLNINSREYLEIIRSNSLGYRGIDGITFTMLETIHDNITANKKYKQ